MVNSKSKPRIRNLKITGSTRPKDISYSTTYSLELKTYNL